LSLEIHGFPEYLTAVAIHNVLVENCIPHLAVRIVKTYERVFVDVSSTAEAYETHYRSDTRIGNWKLNILL
jgi:hypothetical protein